MAKKQSDPIAQIVQLTISFLKSKGGLSNGYRTYVEGTISQGGSSIKWSVPKIDDYTGHQVKSMADKFVLDVAHILISHDIHEICFSIRHIEHGAYDMYVHEKPKPIRISWV